MNFIGFQTSIEKFVSNKVKGRISKRVFQENSTPNFPKHEHFLPPDTHTYVKKDNEKIYETRIQKETKNISNTRSRK